MSNDKRFKYIMVKYMIGRYTAGKNIWTVMKRANDLDVLWSQKEKPNSRTIGIVWFQLCKQKCGDICTEKVAGNTPRYFLTEEIQLTLNFSLLSASKLLCVGI